MIKSRAEHDILGQKKVPGSAYYGISTQRAYENFQISGILMGKEQCYAIAEIKIAASRANKRLGFLSAKKANAIEKAAGELIKGKFDDDLVIDVFQAGAGTPTHMNVNEIIANRATELLGGKRGEYRVHPNDDVNMGQSTNDVFPTAMRIALLKKIPYLKKSLEGLRQTIKEKSRQWRNIIKTGRTHLQDAVPITYGQEIGAWGATLEKFEEELDNAEKKLCHVPLGGNAVGTGINTHKNYRDFAVKELGRITGLKIRKAKDLFESTQSMGDFVHFSGILREIAVELTRIANDIRLLNSGPRAGLNELILPAVMPGSSIMPGKVNPSMAEMLNMVCFQVIGNDKTIEAAAQAGQLELNVMMPVIIHNLLESVRILANGVKGFDMRCFRRIKVNKNACKRNLENSLGLATFLNPAIGYKKAASVSKEAFKKGKSIAEILKENKILPERDIKKIMDKKNFTKPNLENHKKTHRFKKRGTRNK